MLSSNHEIHQNSLQVVFIVEPHEYHVKSRFYDTLWEINQFLPNINKKDIFILFLDYILFASNKTFPICN